LRAKFLVVAVVAFLVGALVGTWLPTNTTGRLASSLSSVTLQPGQQVTVIAATPSPTPSPKPTPSPTPKPTSSPTPVPTPSPSPAPTAPPAPTGLTAIAANKSVTLSWSALLSISYYRVYRNGVLVASPSASPYTDTGLTNGVTYSYQISAVTSGAVEGPKSAVVTVIAGVPSRPWAAPVTTATYEVPGAITHDGSADASTALNAWIATVPDGSVIDFPLGSSATYLMNLGIALTNRNNLIFQGNGARLLANGSGSNQGASLFHLNQGNSHISILNFVLTGNNPQGLPYIYDIGTEAQSGVSIWGSSYVEVANCTISHTYGDAVYINGNGITWAPSDSIWVHDNVGTYLGRNAVSPISATNLIVERNNFDLIGMHVFDIEPDYSQQINAYITFRNNVIGRYGYNSVYTSYFFAANGATGQKHDITVSGNTVVGNPAQGNGYGPVGLNAVMAVLSSPRSYNVTFTSNSTSQTVPGPALDFEHIDTVTVQHNTQPLSSGVLGLYTDCTSVTSAPNP